MIALYVARRSPPGSKSSPATYFGELRMVTVWLEREDILAAFRRAESSRIQILEETTPHENDAYFSFAAAR